MAASLRMHAAAIVLALSACGDDHDAPPPPLPPPDVGGVWAGTWGNWTTGMTPVEGPMVLELHSLDGAVSGFATIPLVDGGLLGPGGMYGVYDEPLSGSVSGDAIALSGNGAQLAGWIEPPQAASHPWDRPVWELERLVPPFDGALAPVDLSGAWTVVPVSSMGQAPTAETLTFASVQDHLLEGTIQRLGGDPIDLVAGRSSGGAVWFAIHSDVWAGYAGLPKAFRVWAGTFDGDSGQGVYVEYQTQWLHLWDRGTWTASRP